MGSVLLETLFIELPPALASIRSQFDMAATFALFACPTVIFIALVRYRPDSNLIWAGCYYGAAVVAVHAWLLFWVPDMIHGR